MASSMLHRAAAACASRGRVSGALTPGRDTGLPLLARAVSVRAFGASGGCGLTGSINRGGIYGSSSSPNGFIKGSGINGSVCGLNGSISGLHGSSTGAFDTDLLVIGCGIAGSAAALQAARLGLHVTMLSSAPNKDDCNSFWAQGGIIYKAEDDSPELLAADVHTAGAGICNDSAVMKLAVEGPQRVEEMLLSGSAEVPFDRDLKGHLSLCLEASHNRARIIHWRDATGQAITTSVQAAVSAHPNIQLLTSTTAVDLALAGEQCVGAHVLSQENKDDTQGTLGNYRLKTIHAPATVLATGGLGDLYAHTSNPPSARGAGFAMARRAGAALSCMEYVQFHPTTLHIPGHRSFLLTEALRGEGAKLVDATGRCFAKNYHPGGDLAPRDVVSRTILSEMRLQKASHMFLDISHRPADWIRDRFPSIHQHCLQVGFDMTSQPLPVVPAAHYFCGGVDTDLVGRTTLSGLFAAGEVACTGLHGANRLASTSLLEGLVWGCSIGDHLADKSMPDSKDGLAASADLGSLTPPNVPESGAPVASNKALSSAWKELRTTLWQDAGVVRRASDLKESTHRLSNLAEKCSRLYENCALHPDTVDLRNGAQTGAMIAAAAAGNSQSIGTHFVEDDEDDHQALEAGSLE